MSKKAEILSKIVEEYAQENDKFYPDSVNKHLQIVEVCFRSMKAYHLSKINISDEEVEFVDDFLARCEDWLHGQDGEDCTKARKILAKLK